METSNYMENFPQQLQECKEMRDIILNLLPKESILKIHKDIEKLKKEEYSTAVETPGEKCTLLIVQFMSSEFYPKRNYIPEILEAEKNMPSKEDLEGIGIFMPEECKSIRLHEDLNKYIMFANIFFKKKEVYDACINDPDTTEKQKEILKNCYKGICEIDKSNFYDLFDNEEDLRDLMFLYKKNAEIVRASQQGSGISLELKMMKIAKILVPRYRHEYEMVLACRTSESDLMTWMDVLDHWRFDNKEYYPYYNVVTLFELYSSCYDEENWRDILLGFLVHAYFENPSMKVGLMRFLCLPEMDGGSPYVNVFCDEVENYFTKMGIITPIDFNVIPSRRKYVYDSNIEHTKWFQRIPKCKYDCGTDNMLYIRIQSLYNKLKNLDWIDCSESLFAYRLTGLGDVPFNPDIVIKWKKTPRELGFLILGLYHYYDTTNDKIVSPSYSMIQKYFGVPNNINSVSKSWHNNKTWYNIKAMLEECGFSNVDVVEVDKAEKNAPK